MWITFQKIIRETPPSINLWLLIFSGYAIHFYTAMQYSKAIQKYEEYFFPVFSGFGECFGLGWKYFVSPNLKNWQITNSTQIRPFFIHHVYMGKYLENHVSCIAYGIAQTAVVCVVSTDTIPISARPSNHSVRTTRFYFLPSIICQYSSNDFSFWSRIDSRGAT